MLHIVNISSFLFKDANKQDIQHKYILSGSLKLNLNALQLQKKKKNGRNFRLPNNIVPFLWAFLVSTNNDFIYACVAQIIKIWACADNCTCVVHAQMT